MVEKPRILVSHPSDSVEGDCACPDSGLASVPSPRTPTTSAWQITPGLHRAQLPGDYELVFNPLGFSNIVVLNPPACAVLDSFSPPRPLDRIVSGIDIWTSDLASAVNQLATLGLLHPAGSQPQLVRSTPSTLTAWLHVTNACNLRCTYCYVNKTDEAMDDATGRAAVEAVFRSAVRNGFRAVKLKYAGGEATLNFRLVKALHEYAGELAARTGLALREVVLSNGVALTHAMIAYLRDKGIRLMISLDGVGAAHDAQRTFANGRGSFTQVAHAIDRAVYHGLLPDLSITITGRNAGSLPDAVTFALDRDLRFNLNFYRENDCSASYTDLVADQMRMITGMKAAFAVIEERLPRRRLIDGLVDRSSFDQPHEYACGAGHNYMVIDEHGRVARCQMEIERTITDVMAEDPLQVIRLEQRGFQNVPVTEKEECRACVWRYWCAGGCSLLTFRTTGRTDVKSPYCNVYKALYPDMLRLEGLRLLKWAESP